MKLTAWFGWLAGAVAMQAMPYRLEDVRLPAQMVPEISAVQFSPTGRLVVANRHGEVWICDPAKLDWQRFAYGLHEPMGVFVAADDDIYVAQRPELTRLRDTDGDGQADHYQTLNDAWGVTDNWHEFVFGPHRDAENNFVLGIALPDTAGAFNFHSARTPTSLAKIAQESKPSAAQWQGWVVKVTPAGELVPWASGFRQAAGVGISPDGEVFITDQQGDYIGSSPLIHARRGRFYGHPASLKWSPGFAQMNATHEQLAAMRTPPSVVLPHGSMGGSLGDPVWDTTEGKFGPFAGQVFIGDFTKLIARVDLEIVGGEYQGACFPFLRDATGVEAFMHRNSNLAVPAGKDGKKYFRDAPPLPGTRLRQGNNRLAFAPDGSLYLGQTTRGWGIGEGLQRLTWTGEMPVEIKTMRLTERGFALRFTVPMDRKKLADHRQYRFERFRYLYQRNYGSPRVDVSTIAVREVAVSADGLGVELTLAALDPGYIYRLEIDGLASAAGEPIGYPLAYYTVNRLHSGRIFTGPLDRPINPDVKTTRANAESDVQAGRQIYLTYCVACHQANGRGGGIPGFAAADFVGENTPLRKNDGELLAVIAAGVDAKGMPAFGEILSESERRDVLAFLRQAFGRR